MQAFVGTDFQGATSEAPVWKWQTRILADQKTLPASVLVSEGTTPSLQLGKCGGVNTLAT